MKLKVLDRHGLRHPIIETRNDGRLCVRHHGYRLALDRKLGKPGQALDGDYEVVTRIPKSNPHAFFRLIVKDFKGSRGTILLCFDDQVPPGAHILDKHENDSGNVIVLALVPE